MTIFKEAVTRILFCCVTILVGVAWCDVGSFASTNPYLPKHGVVFSTGNKYHFETDVTLVSPVSSLTFKRYYNSQSQVQGEFGYGWRGGVQGQSSITVESRYVILTTSSGKKRIFHGNSTDGWRNSTGKLEWIIVTTGGYRYVEHDGTVTNYDNSGNILSRLFTDGYEVEYAYDSGNLVGIIDSFDKRIRFIYEGYFINRVVTPVGDYSYGYDSNGNLISVQSPDGSVKRYLYDDPNDPNNLTSRVDENNITIETIQYDLNDRVVSSAFSNGEDKVIINYLSALDRQIVDEGGNATNYKLVVEGGVARVSSYVGSGCSSCGSDSNESYTYNDRLQILTKTDSNNVTTSYTYDNDGNRNTTTKAVGTTLESTVTKNYVPGSSLLQDVTKDSVSNPGAQKVTTYNRDANGNVTSIQEDGFNGATAITRTTTYTYDTYGRVATVDGPRTDVNDTVAYAYYPNDAAQGSNRAFLHTITNAFGHTITYENYNGYGKAERIVDANNIATVLSYYPNGNLDTRTTAGVTVDYDYYPNGSLQKVALPGNRTINYQYSASGNLEEVSDILGNKIVYSYDSEGRQIGKEVFDPQNNLTAYLNFDYDFSDRLHKVIQPDNYFVQMDYDEANNLVQRVNQLGEISEYFYDELNRLTSVDVSGVTVQAIAYDSDNNQTSVTDGEQKTTSFTYDDFGRVITRTSPDTGLTSYGYDEAGNLVSKTDANLITVTYGYDVLNRLVSITYPDPADNISHVYDQGVNGIGRLTQVDDSTGTTDYIYDNFGRLVSETRNQDGLEFQTVYGYNDNSEIDTVTYPTGRVVTYNRNSVGDVDSVTTTNENATTTIASGIQYKPFGPLNQLDLDNGISVVNSFDSQYRLTGTNAGTIFNRSYSYYADSKVKDITDSIDTIASQHFTYDNQGRLKTALGKYGSISWNFDNVGNRLDQSTDTELTNYSYETGTNLLTQSSGNTTINYSYDDVGNQMSRGDVDLSWSQDNRLIEAQENSATIGSYGYDYRGLRSMRSSGSVVVHSIYDMDGNLILETDNSGVVLNEYVYLDGVPLALINQVATISEVDGQTVTTYTDHTYYYISDQLSTAQVLVDEAGSVAWQGNYSPYGQVDVVVNTVENKFRFPGQFEDSETGLYYNWHRFYDPETGRYISADPIGLAGGMNLYAYVGGDPVNRSDPKGLWFGADDIVTGPVDEVIVIGGLSVMAMSGNEWASDALDSLGDLLNDKYTSNNNCNDPCKQLEKEIRQLQKGINSHIDNIREHLDKYNQYSKDPLSMDNEGSLQNLIDAGRKKDAWNYYYKRRKRLMGTIKKHMGEGHKKGRELEEKIRIWKKHCRGN